MLNKQQEKAVKEIYGPVMVLAGPGTGKTQLLSHRVEEILKVTDAEPSNILCLTYTENGALNMRERLATIIGADAYKVMIGTFHSFGRRIISENQDYFEGRLLNPIDELRQYQVLDKIIEKLPLYNSLRWTDRSRIIDIIGKLKKAALTPDNLSAILKQNIDSEAIVNKQINDFLVPIKGKSARKAGESLNDIRAAYEKILELIVDNTPQQIDNFKPSLQLFADSLQQALVEASASSKPLTAWKNASLDTDAKDRLVFRNVKPNRTLMAIVEVYRSYQKTLADGCFYDYDDMILELIRALEKYDDLRFSLQERYQYIMIDEFQDTNDSQCRIIELLTDNPVNENKPNIMAVGDDDQAIMGFQGADHTNWEIFKNWRDVVQINLSDNYRSSQDILDMARSVAGQIAEKPDVLRNFIKSITAKRQIVDTEIARVDFDGELAEIKWIAKKIKQIPRDMWHEVAIIAPKHRLLEKLLPYLRTENITVNYERRDNILESKTVTQIVDILELALGLLNNPSSVRHLWAQVLSQEHWNISPIEIWRLSWQAREEHKHWAEVGIESKNDELKFAVRFINKLSVAVQNNSFDTVLGMIIGTVELDNSTSPFKAYYQKQPDDIYYDTVMNLTIIHDQFIKYDSKKTVDAFLNFINAYQAAGIEILNTNPFKSDGAAVNILTPYGAKGLEFEYVFLPFLSQENWASSRGLPDISLPNNLLYIRNRNIDGDEKLRVLFVAMTRVKSHLYMTRSRADMLGKPMQRLSYLMEKQKDDESVIAEALPEKYQAVQRIRSDKLPIDSADIEKLWSEAWRDQHTPSNITLRELLRNKIEKLNYTATSLTKFYDVQYGGPKAFFENVILNFPSPISDSLEFGNAVHEILDKYSKATKKPTGDEIMQQFINYVSDPKRGINADTRNKLISLARHSLPTYFLIRGDDLAQPAKTEHQVSANINNIQIGGKLDRLEINEKTREITVVDFKTGKGSSNDASKYKNTNQLYFYKILLENSIEFKNYKVVAGRLEFVRADEEGNISTPLLVTFEPEREQHTIKLLNAMHKLVNNFEFPEIPMRIAKIPKQNISAKVMREFEDYIIDKAQLC